MIREAIAQVVAGQALGEADAAAVMEEIMRTCWRHWASRSS